ncbi:MAG: D-glycerate dehydrogenase [Betaproteobacteria bacterium]|jgi:gluconate 2-dehydrogenase|nr:D-glycerate dehydrogenase [Burkholderiales bacterium]NBX91441.1 D-glycerate dehydrogenase [Betaproteobacteria bacterium]
MKPKILVARPIFESVLQKLAVSFEVTDNQIDHAWEPAEWARQLGQHDGTLTTGSDPVNALVLGPQPRLKIAANMAVGFNNFDVPAMTSAGVVASNTPDVLTETTADFGFALIMATARRMTESEHFLRAGLWKQWRYDMFAGAEVHGSTLGILGMGRIGQAIAKRAAHGFGMEVIYHNRSRLDADKEAQCKARFVDKQTLLQSADHLILVLPYSHASHHCIGAAELAQMKPTATLINIARGGIVDDAALAQALLEKRIAGAGLDVYEGEPSVHPELLKLPNVVLTPHIASATVKTRLAMADLAADNIIAFFSRGHALTPLNTVAAGRA